MRKIGEFSNTEEPGSQSKHRRQVYRPSQMERNSAGLKASSPKRRQADGYIKIVTDLNDQILVLLELFRV